MSRTIKHAPALSRERLHNLRQCLGCGEMGRLVVCPRCTRRAEDAYARLHADDEGLWEGDEYRA